MPGKEGGVVREDDVHLSFVDRIVSHRWMNEKAGASDRLTRHVVMSQVES